MRLFPADVRMNPVPTVPAGAPFAHSPYLLPPRSAVRVTARAAAQRSERTLDAGEYRGPLNGRCQAVFYPQILLKTQKDFEEARKILNLSPRAATALLRVCVE